MSRLRVPRGLCAGLCAVVALAPVRALRAQAAPPAAGCPGAAAAGVLPAAAVSESLTVAYNAHDADGFARWLADTVVAGTFGVPGAPTVRGRAALREQARRTFAAVPALRAARLARVASPTLVVDRERLEGLPGGPREDVAITVVQHGCVARLWSAALEVPVARPPAP